MKQRTVLNKEAIMLAKDSSFSEVYVEEWDGYVRVHVISAKDRIEFEGKYTKKDGAINFEHK